MTKKIQRRRLKKNVQARQGRRYMIRVSRIVPCVPEFYRQATSIAKFAVSDVHFHRIASNMIASHNRTDELQIFDLFLDDAE
jgi:hypothetical protein